VAIEAASSEITREATDMTSSPTMEKVSIEEEKTSQQDSTNVDCSTSTENNSVIGAEGDTANNTKKTPELEDSLQDNGGNTIQASNNMSPTKHIKENSVATTTNVEDTTSSETANEQEMATITSKKAVTFEVTTTPPAQPTKLSPKEWCTLQDEWLHSTMRAEMDDESLQGILTMIGYCEGR